MTTTEKEMGEPGLRPLEDRNLIMTMNEFAEKIMWPAMKIAGLDLHVEYLRLQASNASGSHNPSEEG